MAVNQSPMYQKAEERYRTATAPADKLAALEEMFRLVPKHKASEKLQAQIKQKIKTLREETVKAASRGSQGAHDPYAVPKQGAGQVRLLGEANVGKSAIVGALSNAKVVIEPFPHSTHAAVPGMALAEDVPIQLVDMPPVTLGAVDPMLLASLRSADALLLVVDLSALDLLDQLERPLTMLREARMKPVSTPTIEFGEDFDDADNAMLPKRVLVAANKCDLPGAADNFDGLKELSGCDLKMVRISAETKAGLPEMMNELFALLNVIRVYAKKPGKPVDKSSPFILPVGGTVHDMAAHVHSELAEKLKGARIWGGTVHDGQQVTAAHVLTDKNVVELHF